MISPGFPAELPEAPGDFRWLPRRAGQPVCGRDPQHGQPTGRPYFATRGDWGYPLVICYIAIENDPIYSGFTH
jgi:hypothetical protein